MSITATWDAPPTSSAGWDAFETAFDRFLMAQAVSQPIVTKASLSKRQLEISKQNFEEFEEPPDLGQDEKYKLFPFQAKFTVRIIDSL